MTAAPLREVGAELAIPDPRNQPVPSGWFERVAAPAILTTENWVDLDEYEARLRAVASYVDSFSGDALEFEKALRIIEKRRGDLLGVDVKPGERTDLSTLGQVDESTATKNRWRSIARAWDKVWPHVREAKSRNAVTQAAILRFIETGVYFSSETDLWATPQELFEQLNTEFNFTLDVCANPENAKVKWFYSEADDGLSKTWKGSCWMNPPYGKVIGDWVRKAYESSTLGTVVVCLVPARVDTAWWWDYCIKGEVRFLRGRLKFGGHANSAPFPSAVVVFPSEPKVVWWER